MTYESKWVSPSAAVEQLVKSTACSQEQAQWGICRALSDGVIEIRAHLLKHDSTMQTSRDVVTGTVLQIPTELKPNDIDWQHSRPKKPWWLSNYPRHHSGLWHLARIEFSSTNVTRIISPNGATPDAPRSEKKPTRKHRERPSREAAEIAIKDLWPNDLPPPHELQNYQLVDRVIKRIKERGWRVVSRDTILRAAGRK
ncbi:hypothetical protein [Bradyrhizobium brasilense]|uniref:Uncharacterized protein n=1 Tax=Bradyrhizobium brasilense TaxID=1419277 RepID=A0A1G7A0U3_9BRAD|nr:hypothetical protein [Bradyrhizobium brasilense]MCC8971768.1 hypothetical protein [Bradyrhizobium brasilense]SDE08442.1 hypothetical protein SAMN05216337_1019135 [Bradyrhizobium brasilense]